MLQSADLHNDIVYSFERRTPLGKNVYEKYERIISTLKYEDNYYNKSGLVSHRFPNLL